MKEIKQKLQSNIQEEINKCTTYLELYHCLNDVVDNFNEGTLNFSLMAGSYPLQEKQTVIFTNLPVHQVIETLRSTPKSFESKELYQIATNKGYQGNIKAFRVALQYYKNQGLIHTDRKGPGARWYGYSQDQRVAS